MTAQVDSYIKLNLFISRSQCHKSDLKRATPYEMTAKNVCETLDVKKVPKRLSINSLDGAGKLKT